MSVPLEVGVLELVPKARQGEGQAWSPHMQFPATSAPGNAVAVKELGVALTPQPGRG